MINVYLQDNIKLLKTEYDKWGNPTTTESTIKGRFEFKTEMVRSLEGEQVVSSARVLVPADADINHEDKIEYNSRQYSILAIELGKDFSNRVLRLFLK